MIHFAQPHHEVSLVVSDGMPHAWFHLTGSRPAVVEQDVRNWFQTLPNL
jgi:hypothetical protein